MRGKHLSFGHLEQDPARLLRFAPVFTRVKRSQAICRDLVKKKRKMVFTRCICWLKLPTIYRIVPIKFNRFALNFRKRSVMIRRRQHGSADNDCDSNGDAFRLYDYARQHSSTSQSPLKSASAPKVVLSLRNHKKFMRGCCAIPFPDNLTARLKQTVGLVVALWVLYNRLMRCFITIH